MLCLRFSTPSSPPPRAATTKLNFALIPPSFGGKPANSNHIVAKSNYKKVFSTIISASSSSSSNDHQGGVIHKDDLKRELMPKHVAIMLDGHRRWAKATGMPEEVSKLSFRKTIRDVALLCFQHGIEVLSYFGSPPASWHLRPKEEIADSRNTFESILKSDVEMCKIMGIRISFIGNRAGLPEPLQDLLTQAEEYTKNNTRLHFIVAMYYTGRVDIVEACKSLSEKVKNGLIQEEDINDELFQQQLQTSCCSGYPNPDLFIRTGGKIRLANYMLWQMANTKLVFVDKLAPDFGGDDFVQALGEYQKRSRCVDKQK